jgi:hypothetical protein
MLATNYIAQYIIKYLINIFRLTVALGVIYKYKHKLYIKKYK